MENADLILDISGFTLDSKWDVGASFCFRRIQIRLIVFRQKFLLPIVKSRLTTANTNHSLLSRKSPSISAVYHFKTKDRRQFGGLIFFYSANFT